MPAETDLSKTPDMASQTTIFQYFELDQLDLDFFHDIFQLKIQAVILVTLWNHLETSVCMNLAIGMIFHSLIINKASKVLWQFVFHLINFTSVLIPLVQPDLHPKFFQMTFYSILVVIDNSFLVYTNSVINLNYLNAFNKPF